MIKCKVKVVKVLYPKTNMIDGGFAIVSVKVLELVKGDTPIIDKFGCVVVKGSFPAVKQGEEFYMTFNQPTSTAYGINYNLVSVNVEIDENNKKEVNAYIDLICPRNIARELKKIENGYTLLKERNIDELLKIKGLGEATLKKIFNKMTLYEDVDSAMAKLIPLGLTKQQVVNICKSLGGARQAIEVCKTNPYSLASKVDGIGFKIADDIALKMGFELNNPKRIRCAVENMFFIEGENGKSYLTVEQVVNFIFNMINVYDSELILKCLIDMQEEGEIVVSEDGISVCHKKYFNLEKQIAEEIKRISSYKTNINVQENWMDIIREKEKKQGWGYDSQQLKGIETMLFNNLTVIAGKAGTGKSTITDALCDILNDYDISMCCLSAKASQRLREVTGRECYTIHKLLGIGSKEQLKELFCDVLIIDEASMINGTLFLALLKVCKKTKIIILGDDGQLSSIGNCSVFSDLLESERINVVRLENIHRQAQKSAIVTQSIKIREQQPICDKNFKGKVIMGEFQDLELNVSSEEEVLSEVIMAFKEEMKKTNNILEVQIITPTKARGKCSTTNINSIIQPMYNKCEGKFIVGYNKCSIFVGDKIINTKNNYKTLDINGEEAPIWNGSIGLVTKVLGEVIYVDFQGIGEVRVESDWFKFLNLAYAITIHSSQGSQWTSVICTADAGAYVLLNVELLYTGITRAIKMCRLIISDSALNKAMKTVEQKTKQTLLKVFL